MEAKIPIQGETAGSRFIQRRPRYRRDAMHPSSLSCNGEPKLPPTLLQNVKPHRAQPIDHNDLQAISIHSGPFTPPTSTEHNIRLKAWCTVRFPTDLAAIFMR